MRRISVRGRTVQGSLAPFRTRGDDCRRVLFTADDQSQTVIELASFNEVYAAPVTAAIRARSVAVEGTALVLQGAEYRLVPDDLASFANTRDGAHQCWGEGIRYRRELRDANDVVVRPGLRAPQLGRSTRPRRTGRSVLNRPSS